MFGEEPVFDPSVGTERPPGEDPSAPGEPREGRAAQIGVKSAEKNMPRLQLILRMPRRLRGTNAVSSVAGSETGQTVWAHPMRLQTALHLSMSNYKLNVS